MRILLLLLSASTIMLTGCQTKSTAARFEQATSQVLACQQRVLHYQEQMAKQNIQFTDERNALVFFVVQELARVKETNQLAYCDDLIVAMVQADSAKTQGLIRGGISLGGVALGLIGLDILMDGTGRGDHSGDTWNISGSRVNSKSGNVSGGGSTTVSSSGEGLGLGNTFATGSGQSVGGLEPRTTPINGDVNTLETGSNSGQNEPITIPVQGAPELAIIE